jgi:hypothetical protein
MTEAVVAPVAPAAAPTAPGAPVIPVFTEQTYDEAGVKAAEAPAPEKPAEVGTPAQNVAEQAPADKPVEGTGTTDQPPEKQGKSRFERRLDKAYRERAEARARAEFLEKQLADLKPKEQAVTSAPRLEDFSDVQEYAKAYAKYESGNAIKQYEQKQHEESFKRATQHLAAEWDQKATRADKKYDDFDDVVGEMAPTNPVSIAIMQAENGEDIAYYLGTHLTEAKRISQLDPLSQAREIGRLETKLLAEPPKAKTPSQAPAPIIPVTGKTVAASDEPLDTDDINTWMKKANAKSLKAISGA